MSGSVVRLKGAIEVFSSFVVSLHDHFTTVIFKLKVQKILILF